MRLALDTVPELLRPSVERWCERAAQAEALGAGFERLSAAQRAELPRVVAASEFMAAALIQDPAALGWFAEHDLADPAAHPSSHYLQAVSAAPNEAEALRLLREWRRRELLRIAWRDVAGRASVQETLFAASDFADAAIRAAVEAAAAQLKSTFGVPRNLDGEPVPLIVIGMGKLGGRELNFSSDIDLILLYPHSGQSDGPTRLDNEEYFVRLARQLVRLLGQRTADGFVFRVDLRLRPFGDSGPLVSSFAALEDYLQHHGRDWERYAWIKARATVGAEAYVAAYEELVRPFVYRRYLDFGVFDSLRDMKAMIEREVSRRELEGHLKLGRGGIREIEFIVQSLQLVRGGSDRRLQSAELMTVMPLLVDSKLLLAADLEALRGAYLTLRKAENAVQMLRDEQTHVVPEEAADRARVALIMNEPDWAAALRAIEAARAAVGERFDALLFGAPQARRTEERDVGWLDLDVAGIEQALKARAFAAGARPAIAAALQGYRDSAAYRRLEDTGKRRVQVILDRLVSAAAERREPALVVTRVLRVLEAIGARSSYLALLKEQPPALSRLIEICAISGFLARQVADFPLLLDELIDAKAFDELPTRESFVQQLEARTARMPADDPDRQVEVLRSFQKVAVFQVALADLTGRLPLMRVSDRLTDIAELIVQCCVELAWQQMIAAYGAPVCGEDPEHLRPVRIAVAGYGKLGGLELGYGSDLDLVFLHDSSSALQMTQGERSVDNGVFFSRLGQRIVHLLTMHSAAGRLYAVDMRLRPNGSGGFLMTGIEAFERYQRGEAWTWEHQALLRARAVAGAAPLRAEFEAARRRVLTESVHRDTLRADVADMRQRMRRELSKAKAGEFDMKQGAGGIADIEFLVQYWVLSEAQRHPELVTYSDNIRQLDILAQVGVIAPETAAWLTQTYIDYRGVLHRLSLEGEGERVVPAEPYEGMRERVLRIWQETFV